MKLKIDEELKSLIPKLSDEEYKNLETSCLDEGIRDYIIYWTFNSEKYVIDGHNRLEIAKKHDLRYETIEKFFTSKTDVMMWMIDNQRGRRNLSKQAWLDLGFKRAALLKPKAKDNQGRRTDIFQESEKSYKPVNTTKEAANYAGVSVDTAAKYKKVMTAAPEETKKEVQEGKKSINRAYQEIKKPKETEPKKEVAIDLKNQTNMSDEDVKKGIDDFQEYQCDMIIETAFQRSITELSNVPMVELRYSAIKKLIKRLTEWLESSES